MSKNKHNNIIKWFLSDEVGLSAETLVREHMGFEHKRICYPRDPSDLRRCMILINEVPEIRNSVDSLAGKDKDWKRLSLIWDKAITTLLKEMSKGRTAPITYKMMK